MPELPEMQALAERLDVMLSESILTRVDQLGFSGLKTAVPSPDVLIGTALSSVARRAKYLVMNFAQGPRILMHLSQSGRVDIEKPPKGTRPRGAVVRLGFADRALLLREYGTQRKAGWWVLAAGEEGPLETLGPEPDDPEFSQWLTTSTDNRRLHTLLRDQHVVSGIGRGYADDILHRAQLSPFASLRSLGPAERTRLLGVIADVLAEALTRERTRSGGLSEAKLGERFAVHNRAGTPCLRCAAPLQRVSYDSYEIVYCPVCQTNGKLLADRRLSRLLK
jgi:formamidopyrimidine-DNA glycosylase